jgi:integrase
VAKFRVEDRVIGRRESSYSITGTGYKGTVLRILEDGYFYISADINDIRADGWYNGKRYYKVREAFFDLAEEEKITTDEPIEEIDYEAVPKAGDLVRFLSLDEIIEKYKNKYINRNEKSGVEYNIRAYTNALYYPVIEERGK